MAIVITHPSCQKPGFLHCAVTKDSKISYEHTSCVCRVNELVEVGAELMQWKKMLVVLLFEVNFPFTAMKVEKDEDASPRQWELTFPAFD